MGSSKKTNNPRRTESPDSDCGGYFDDTHDKLRGKERARFKEMLEDLLSAVPDTLTADEVVELTGYSRKNEIISIFPKKASGRYSYLPLAFTLLKCFNVKFELECFHFSFLQIGCTTPH